MFGLQVVMRMVVLVLIMAMVSGILSVWKGYFWVNNSPLLYTPNPPSLGCPRCNHCSAEDETVEVDFQEFQDYDEF
jgi:hypothetical protein